MRSRLRSEPRAGMETEEWEMPREEQREVNLQEEGKRAIVLERLRVRPDGGRLAEKRSKAANAALEVPGKIYHP